MGREVKRVPLDFDWPLNEVWKGYLNPYYQFARDCPFCGGTGQNPGTREIDRSWYDFDGKGNRWCAAITQDELDALIEAGRFTQETKRMGHPPTLEWVNAHSNRHDAINRWICVETRAKRLGVYGQCEHCQGDGTLWLSPEKKALSEAWQEEEPPVGDGWQLWEIVSEGSPISQVFATREKFVDYLVVREHASREAAERFCEDAWAPSAVMNVCADGSAQWASGVQAAAD